MLTDWDHELDIFGQQSTLNIYTQLTLCYDQPKEIPLESIVKTIEFGLTQVAEAFPFVSCHIIKDDLGIYKFKELEKIPLIIKDLRDDSTCFNMEKAHNQNFPFSMFDEELIAPCRTLPSFSPGEIIPVFLVQMTFIPGGLWLTFVSHHQAMDMTTHGHVMHLLNQACHHLPFTEEELRVGSIVKRGAIPLLPSSEDPFPFIKHQITKPLVPKDDALPPKDTLPESLPEIPEACWANFLFSSESLLQLKEQAQNDLKYSLSFVSTDDVLTSFLWKSILRARSRRIKDESTLTTLARAIDPRSFIGLPSTYMGIVQNMTYHTHAMNQLDKLSLGNIASELRCAIDPKTSDIAHATKALATALHLTSDKHRINVTSQINNSTDIMISSWSKLTCYDYDFNLHLGTPEAIRRPRFQPYPGLIYLLPKRLNGEIVVAISLLTNDMKQLTEDLEFMQYSQYIG